LSKEFYSKCGDILGIAHEYKVPYRKKTRWNARVNGNGRFIGFGLVRKYNDSCYHIVSRKGTKEFASEQDVFDYLKEFNP